MEKIKQSRRVILISLMIGIGLMISGCGKADLSPREINPEVDTCVVCNMSIVHEDYAAQAVLSNGDKLIFDDVGCLVQYAIDQQEDAIGASYVKEYETEEWIDSTKAFYVYHQDFWTPMSYGVLAFSTKDKAEAFIDKEGKGTLMTPEDLKDHKWGVHPHE
ncbi:nitrous oxide reductase accessory protein NosL [Rossellomorea vietnamensis]|uniref:nitrous oxide reductase accessory protein NosL n=1 Tax=Rossellomorea vietnamensis TaxID=218284 RepID=UPI001E2A58EE|nr:nitrous oxide reductase accessory protein NosL [Rossellomorea vietnamensis]MCC5803597.1 nitrous oxide reductase accessory protein NosL [Rossellomorea vietnamensis]